MTFDRPDSQVPIASSDDVDAHTSHDTDDIDPKKALLHFLHLAADNAYMLSDLENQSFSYINAIKAIKATPGDDTEMHPYTHFENVPHTIAPVKGKPGYIQTASGVKFAWKFEVQMQQNWYEAAITAGDQSPFDVPFVVDWTVDYAASHEPTAVVGGTPARYLVLPWGVNDPTEANRTLQYELGDVIASPAGWHNSSIVNLNTTVGNNALVQENWKGYKPGDGDDNRWWNNRRPDVGEKRV